MPSSMTHTYFGLDVMKKISNNCQDKISEKIEYYKLFCQGSDPFMFYHFLIGKKAKYGMEIQKKMHHSNTKNFFIYTIELIQKNHYVNCPEVMAYLYGYICHYFLDLYTHPFIYYKSGIFKKNDKNTYRYNGIHQKIEYNIDLYMIKQREMIKPYQYRVYQNIFNVNYFPLELTKIINDSIGHCYHYSNISNTYLSSIRYMKLFFKYINYDLYGIKLKLYQLIDKVTPKSIINLEELSYHHNFEDDLSYLNLDHLSWNYPWSQSEIFTYSFFDLYEIALNKSVETIQSVTKMLENDKLDYKLLDNLFQNLDFATGRPCGEQLEMKFFEF